MATAQPVASLITPTRRAREYEMIYILRSTVTSDEAARVATRVKEILDAEGARLLKVDNWGRRKLAYLIEGASRGVFVYLQFVAYEGAVAELERNLRLLDSVIRYQTVQLKSRVEMDKVEVDPAELEFSPLEDAEEEEEPGIAQRLGLVERPRPPAPADPYASEAAAATTPDAYVDGVAPAAEAASKAAPEAASKAAPDAPADESADKPAATQEEKE